MLSKIAEQPQNVKPVVWPQVRNSNGQSAGAFLAHEAPTGHVAELKQRIAELERSRQSEVAEAQKAAFQQGRQQAKEEASAEVKTASERLAQTLAELASFKRKIRMDAEMELLNLSLAIARRILNRELLTDPEAIQGVVHAALNAIQRREIYRVRVYPAGAEAVRSALERTGAASVEIVADASLKTGDLLIETALGELDASLDTQLQEIQRGFADRLSLR
jgi:flagellar assembly protein FliH